MSIGRKISFITHMKNTKFFIMMAVLVCALPMLTFAESGKTEVMGTVYEFEKGSHYEFSEDSISQRTDAVNTYGTFFVDGDITTISEKSGVPSYEVAEGNLTLYYNYGNALLNADEDTWHLVNDKSKKVAGVKLDANIMKGAIILQTSKDGKTWTEVETICNAFSDTPIRTSPIYSTTDMQLANGCYYRIIVVYELSVRTENGKFLFINTDKYDWKKYAEVYEFYAGTNSDETAKIDPNQTYTLGSKVKVKNFDGYFGEKTIDENDIHYGWELGNFFVSGYTDKIENSSGNIVFLKNIGDRVTLWFKLNQDINCLNGIPNLSITNDTEGYDQYFETSRMNFGRGALIIRHTDYNNTKSSPTIYTNYLEANASVGADTKVQLFEEGDYEVALDYEVTKDELIDKIGHYRIFFKFSVRNGNCMAYPIDVKTGSELTNSSMTENGFRLDLAKSRYLKINLKKEILKDSADGLIEDTRFNGPAQDGAEYTEEGIYTITTSNEYTGQSTVKKIYVGENDLLRACAATGLSVSEINSLIADGATVSNDGTIQLADKNSTGESTEQETTATSPGESDVTVDQHKSLPFLIAILVIVCICMIVALGAFVRKKKLSNHDEKGGNRR